jgi:hypothetical protein
MKTIGDAVLAILLAAATWLALLFICSAISVIQEFHLYPSDGAGGFALFLIEVVVALFAGLIVGLFCLQRLAWRRRFTQSGDPEGRA